MVITVVFGRQLTVNSLLQQLFVEVIDGWILEIDRFDHLWNPGCN